MKYMRIGRVLAIALCMLALTPSSPTMAGAAPFGQWRTFKTGRPEHCGGINWCASTGADAMRATNLTSHPTREGQLSVWGANADTLVVVVCTPLDSNTMSATLFSASDSQANAKSWADQIETKMKGIGCL
jgi:hypothetical protein